MSRAGRAGALLVAALVLSLLYGPLALAVVAVVAVAAYVGRFYAPLPGGITSLRLSRRLRSLTSPGSRLRRHRGHEGGLALRRAELQWALRDAWQADAVLRPGLSRTAESLVRGRTERGLDDDPATTRRLLGPDLSDYLASRRGPSPTAAQLDVMLTHLEALR